MNEIFRLPEDEKEQQGDTPIAKSKKGDNHRYSQSKVSFIRSSSPSRKYVKVLRKSLALGERAVSIKIFIDAIAFTQ